MQFRFQPGPVFANLCSPTRSTAPRRRRSRRCSRRCRSSRSRSRGERHRLEPPFFVLATQNPLEMEGTYPLPEAQLDRFLFKLWVPFPSEEDLVAIMERTTGSAERARRAGRRRGAEIVAMQRLARSVPIAPHVTAYAVSLLAATHPDNDRAPGARARVRALRRLAARRPGAGAGGQDPRPAGRPLQRRHRRHPRGGAAGACATGSSATSRARPKASRRDAIVRAVLDAVAPPSVD